MGIKNNTHMEKVNRKGLSEDRLQHLPNWIRKIFFFLTSLKIPAKLIFLVVSVLATVWFIIRVLPKPSRATYPCMQVAMPLMSGFIGWLLSVSTSWLAFRKARQAWLKSGYMAFSVFLMIGLFFSMAVLTSDTKPARADINPWFEANRPIGSGKGIFPGRVVWTHNPGTASWDGKTGYWWEDRYVDQDKTDMLLERSLLGLSGKTRPDEAWDALFFYFNQTKRGLNRGYQLGEKIAVKINQNNTYSHANSEEINATPQLVLSLLKSLVEQAGIPEEKIKVFDASRFITDNLFNKCHSVYPGVIFVDNSGGNGRVKADYIPDAIPYSADNGVLASGLATCAVEADYLINMALLKGHVGQGVTLCAKNWYGVTSIDPDWRKNAHNNFDQNRDGSPRYMTFVDFMGHKDLGGKTMLFIVDGIYANKFVNGVPLSKMKMEPFHGSWPSSIFVSQDIVAVDAVCTDFILAEWPDAPDLQYCDKYLEEAALIGDPPSGTVYDPERDGAPLTGSLGVFEHWNNPLDKKYSRNLKSGDGIELLYIPCGDEH
jgi:hypothetical protein